MLEPTPEPMDFKMDAISPFLEMGAYEALWCRPRTTFKSLAERFARRPGSLPSDFVGRAEAEESANLVKRRFDEALESGFGVRVYGTLDYPRRLRDAAHPVELFYYQGWWDLAHSPSVSVVGSRNPTREGRSLARRLVRALVRDDFTVVSGLAAGIDRTVHETAIEEDGRTIGVIGTPLSHVYPRENTDLQREIVRRCLLVSQVPLRRYESQNYRRNRTFFRERNVTMAALTKATVIVEAGETSGTLVQARAALQQGRKLFVPDRCFRTPGLAWPERLAALGAVRVRDYEEIRERLSA